MEIKERSDGIIKSCLTDKPLQLEDDDSLKARDYANALAQFIENADTPVTIGIQGGWGSGKTSLITILQHQLDSNPEHKALCVLVNAWEHSLFHSTDSKAEVALSLLNGLATGIQKSVRAILESRDNSWLDKSAQSLINPQENTVVKAISFIKSSLRFAGRIGLQVASNVAGAGDMKSVWDDSSAASEAIPPIAENVHNLRVGLGEMIKKITYKGQPVKVVFFIDDLDRVPPPTAVEILDITKNIFDIPDCVFVLAIDYEVIVKGLEEKFGKKDVKNEREFRQYFDKIIQIPFTMPMGAYGDNLDQLLRPALRKLGYEMDQNANKVLGKMAEDARLATGGIPRSIKRIINTLSLLQHISNAKLKKSRQEESVPLPGDIEARFIIVALLINFPEICKKIMERPDFPGWSPTALDLPWKLQFEKNEKELDALKNAAATRDLFDDSWEKVVFCLCSQSDWLKSQAVNVSKLLNRLLVVLNDGEKTKTLSDKGKATMDSILESIKVVSIDSEPQAELQFNDSSVKTDRVSTFFAELQDLLAQKLPAGVVPKHTTEYAKRGETRPYEFSLSDSEVYGALFQYSHKEKSPTVYINFYAPRYGVAQKNSDAIFEKNSGGYEYEHTGTNFNLYFGKPMAWDDFLAGKKREELKEELAAEAVELFEAVDRTQKAFAKAKR